MAGGLRYIGAFILISFLEVSLVLCQPSIYKVTRMSFNSPVFNDIAPVLIKDGIIFCSDKRTSGIKDKTTYDNVRLYNIYIAEKKDTSDWRRPKEIKGIGNALLYYGPVCLTPDNKTVYFTSSILSGKAAKKKNIVNPRGIFIGDLAGTDITNIHPFEYNNTQYSVAHPSISSDGKYLFFASDMPGGQGGSDLYYCELINDKWGSPVNLGNKINTSLSENYPYMHPSGRFYFTSNRPGGLGGLDIYYSSLSYGKWDDPVQLPPDINSPADDFAFVAEEDLQTGYFASNRGKDDDIYKFSSTIIRKVSCDTLQINNYCYEFLEENAVKFDTIPFRYQWNFGDGTSAEGAKVIHCYLKPGTYNIRLDVINLVTKEIQNNEKTYELEIKDIEQPYISGPDSCNQGQQIKLNADSTNLPGWNITQYYWNLGDETIAVGKEVDKVYLKAGIYNIQLIVTSAPDAGGVIREACVSKNINVIRKP